MAERRDEADGGHGRRSAGRHASLIPPAIAAATEPEFIELWQRWRELRAAIEQCAADEIEGVEQRLYAASDTLLRFPARRTAEVVIKLATILDMAAIEVGEEESFPWPQLRVLFTEMSRLAQRA
jgi:hypothetical protein